MKSVASFRAIENAMERTFRLDFEIAAVQRVEYADLLYLNDAKFDRKRR